MTATGSGSPAETREVVVLAAHGSRFSPESPALVRGHADRLRRSFGRAAVAAFHAGEPGFGEVLDSVHADRFVVVPFFSAHGYYSSRVLPLALARNRCFGRVPVRITAALGTLAATRELIVRRLLRLIADRDSTPERFSVLVVGHGTRRHPASRHSTESLVVGLRRKARFQCVRAAFLDESPGVEQQLRDLPPGPRVVVPFLIGGGEHAVADLPRLLGLDDQPLRPPGPGTAAGPDHTLLAPSLGAEAALTEIIDRLVGQAFGDPLLRAQRSG